MAMANARGTVLVHHDSIEIRHRRILRHPLIIPRAQVARVLLDDGAATGRARFATGDVTEPLLWTDPVPRRQRADLPLIGDDLLPNTAIVLTAPLAMDAARDWLTAVPVSCELPPPRRHGQARALLLTMDGLEAVRMALVSWPVEQPDVLHAIPDQVAAAAARVPRDAGVAVVLAVVGAVCMTVNPYLLLPIWFAVSLLFAATMVKRRQATAEAARADVAQRAPTMTPEAQATALAAIDANLGASQAPRDWK